MKMIYQKPETLTMMLEQENSLLTASPVSSRQNEGAPTSDGLPTGIGETTDTENPFTDEDGNDKGQGGGSGTTRSKSGMIWDEW